MNHLNDTELNELKDILTRRDATLREEVRDAKDADQADREGFVGVAPDMVDVAQSRRITDFRHAERERDQLELTEIAEAQARIADGSYGECSDCGCEIPVARLRVEPTARRCIDCQERYERTHPAPVPVVPTGQDVAS
ncbi:MAG: TraR/DksA family transcriptional regulator [Aquabacterium sp.]